MYYRGSYISEAAMSGDGSLDNVGIRIQGCLNCPECNQRYDTERALSLHIKFTHGDKVVRVITLQRDGESLVGYSLAGHDIFRFEEYLGKDVKDLTEQLSNKLMVHPTSLALLESGVELPPDHPILDVGGIVVRQDMGRFFDFDFGGR
mmetsp:Transcript_66988/g.119138  ORF Transcript_66988/g.119138 Transcript_66988/m.119138 type:complete len:148 (-) Transcript_66988:46-489(-)